MISSINLSRVDAETNELSQVCEPDEVRRLNDMVEMQTILGIADIDDGADRVSNAENQEIEKGSGCALVGEPKDGN